MPSQERHNLKITPETCRAARSVLSLTIRELAFRAEVGPDLLSKYENRLTRMKSVKLASIQDAFEQLGISFLPPTRLAGPGLRVMRAPLQTPGMDLETSRHQPGHPTSPNLQQ